MAGGVRPPGPANHPTMGERAAVARAPVLVRAHNLPDEGPPVRASPPPERREFFASPFPDRLRAVRRRVPGLARGGRPARLGQAGWSGYEASLRAPSRTELGVGH